MMGSSAYLMAVVATVLLSSGVALSNDGKNSPAERPEVRASTLPTLRTDETLRPVIEKSVRVNYILRDEQDPTLVQVMVQVDHPPTDMAFDMVLRAGDDTWSLGPVGWSIEDGVGWWAYDVDLPESVEMVDVILTPSASAAVSLSRQPPPDRLRLAEIWDGEAIVLRGIQVRRQRVSMVRIPPPNADIARIEALQQLTGDGPVIQQLKHDGNLEQARQQLQQRVQDQPDDTRALYNLGCLAAAESDWNTALESFADIRRLDPSSSLAEKAQRQLRRICAMYLYCAERNDIEAMFMLGRVYERGWGVHTNTQQAKRWYRNAANAGHAEAMYRLAAMYERRVGATIHTPAAQQWYRTQTLEWYRKAAERGNEEAKRWLNTHNSD